MHKHEALRRPQQAVTWQSQLFNDSTNTTQLQQYTILKYKENWITYSKQKV